MSPSTHKLLRAAVCVVIDDPYGMEWHPIGAQLYYYVCQVRKLVCPPEGISSGGLAPTEQEIEQAVKEALADRCAGAFGAKV